MRVPLHVQGGSYTANRRVIFNDLIQVYKILNGFYDLDSHNFLYPAHYSATRGHSVKLYKPRPSLNVCNNFFTFRVVNMWNSIPENILTSPSRHIFKQHRLSTFLTSYQLCR